MSNRRLTLAVCLAGAPLLASPRASAEGAAMSPEGMQLFEQGRDAMKRQDYPAACAKFAESLAHDEKVGTIMNLADCEEHRLHYVSAGEDWQRAAALARSHGDERATFATQRFAAIDARTPKLTLRAAPGLPEGASITRDDVKVEAAALTTAVRVDPGDHLVIVELAGHDPRRYPLMLKEGESRDVVLEAGRAEIPEAHAAPAPAPEAAPGPSASGRKTAGIVIGGVGVLGVAGGVVLGLAAKSAYDGASGCSGSGAQAACSQDGLDKRSNAIVLGNVGTGVFIGGAVLVATGAVLWLTAPRDSSRAGASSRPFEVGVTPGGLRLRGAF